MQAIQTRFLGPTNFRGSRYKATCDAGSLTLESDYALNPEDNHIRAARALITKLGWWHDDVDGKGYGDWYQGSVYSHKAGYVFVCAVKYAKVEP